VLGSAIASSVEEREGVLAQDAADLLEPAALRETLRRDAEALAQKLTARRMLGSPAPAIRDERPLASHLRSRTS